MPFWRPARASIRPLTLKNKFLFALRRATEGKRDEASPRAKFRGERKKEVMPMTDAFERGSHRAHTTKRGRLSEVRPSAAPRSGSRNYAECARARGCGERLLSGGLQIFSADLATDEGSRLRGLKFLEEAAPPRALTNSRLRLARLGSPASRCESGPRQAPHSPAFFASMVRAA